MNNRKILRKNYNKLKKDKKIKLSGDEENFYNMNIFKWDDKETLKKIGTSKPFDDIRINFKIIKKGRSKFTENDIYKIINDVKVAYFTKIN